MKFVVAGLVVAALLALLVSPYASSEPDGLNKVAIDEGFAEHETPHVLADAPTAGYGIESISSERWSTGFAGLLGVTVTFGVCFGITRLAVRRRRPTEDVAIG